MTDPPPPPPPAPPGDRLVLADVMDLRAYERVREDLRRQVIARKRLRRVALGPIVTVVFESVHTVRFQIQEMARVEKIITDEGIQAELDVYNRLLPSARELSATLFIELTNEEDLRRWLPALVGIERSVTLEIATGSGVEVVHSVPEEEHERSLWRTEVTPAVHYLRFPFTEPQAAAFGDSGVTMAVRHPAYDAATALPEATRDEIAGDLAGPAPALAALRKDPGSG